MLGDVTKIAHQLVYNMKQAVRKWSSSGGSATATQFMVSGSSSQRFRQAGKLANSGHLVCPSGELRISLVWVDPNLKLNSTVVLTPERAADVWVPCLWISMIFLARPHPPTHQGSRENIYNRNKQ